MVEMNHLCERTRGEDEKNVFWMRGGNVVLTGMCVLIVNHSNSNNH